MANVSTEKDRTAALNELWREATALGAQVVGDGSPTARLMLVGEAPGKSEVRARRPFVGPAGEVLNRMLDLLAIPRSDQWVTNTVKLRPTAPGVRGEVNRPPSPEEVTAFRSILDREIAIIRPAVIVCLGAVAASALIHPAFKVRQERGTWFTGPNGSRVIATYHPSYLLRLRGPAYEVLRDEMLADLATAWAEVKATA